LSPIRVSGFLLKLKILSPVSLILAISSYIKRMKALSKMKAEAAEES